MYSEIVGVNYQHTKHADARGGGQAKLEENKGGGKCPLPLSPERNPAMGEIFTKSLLSSPSYALLN